LFIFTFKIKNNNKHTNLFLLVLFNWLYLTLIGENSNDSNFKKIHTFVTKFILVEINNNNKYNDIFE